MFTHSYQYFDMLFAVTRTEFTTRYKQASFGFLWIILNPMLQMLIIGIVFSYFVPIKNYFLFIFTGLLPWQFFSLSLNTATSSFVNQRQLLFKSVFPKEIIPLSIVLSNFINLIISEILLLIVYMLLAPFKPETLLLLPIAIIWIVFVTIGFSLLTSTLNVRYRDVAFIVQALLTICFYATPILYSINVLPMYLQKIMLINPLASPFSILHSAFLDHPLPNNILIFSNLGIAIMVFIISLILFRRESSYFIDWL